MPTAVVQATSSSGLQQPYSVAVDSSGTYAYVPDYNGHRVIRVTISGGAITTIYSTSTSGNCANPFYVAVDSSENVYFTCGDTNNVYKATYSNSSYTVSVFNSTISPGNLHGIAVDSSGNVWIALQYGSGTSHVVKCTSGGSCNSTYLSLPSSSVTPWALAIDSSGNLYVSDQSSNEDVLEYKVSNSSWSTIQSCPSVGYAAGCYGIAVDSSGDVYMSTNGLGVYKLTPNGSGGFTSSTINAPPGSFTRSVGVAVDSNGILYVTDYLDNGQSMNGGGNAPSPAYTSLVEFPAAGTGFGSVAVGTASAALPVTFVFTASGQLGSISVLTGGQSGLDFANANTGTCNTTSTISGTCTVNVTFTPTRPGTRYGAVVLKNTSGAVVATAYIYGTGTAPMVNFSPYTQTVVDSNATNSNLLGVEGLVGDAAGNLYLASGNGSYGSSHIYKETLSNGSYTESAISTSSLNSAQWVTVDQAGNLFIADGSNSRILKEAPATSGYTETTAVSFNGGNEIVVDGAGNLYSASGNAGGVYKFTLQSNGTYVSSEIAASSNNPWGVAVDGSGNVYYVTANTGCLYKLVPAGGVYASTSLDTSCTLSNPTGLAIDSSGNLYVANDATSGPISKYTYNSSNSGCSSTLSSCYTKSSITTGVSNPVGIWVDANDNLFIGDTGNKRVLKLDYFDGPTLTYSSTTVGATSSSQTATLLNVGNAALTLTTPTTGTNPSISNGFSISSGTCTQTTTLAAGSSCTAAVSFAPVVSGSITGSLVATDNNLNVTGATNTVTLSGTATAAAGSTSQTITFPQPTTPLVYPASAATLTATASSGLSVFYTVTGPATVSGSTLTYTGIGTVVVTAYQNGNGTYAAATPVSRIVVITPPAANVGTTGATQTATLTITTAGTTNATLGTAIQVLTQGATGLDFAYVSGGTCAAGTAYTVNQTCTVEYSFTPTTPGLRMGAIELFTASGTAPIAVAYIAGIGNGPMGTFTPGTISTVAGSGTQCSSSTATCGDGGSATAAGANMYHPIQVAVDAAGNLYIADDYDNRIRKVTAATGYISTVAGTGTYCSSPTATCGDGGLATSANLYNPTGVAVDGAGNLYIADQSDNRIRKVTAATGYISTVAGTGTACSSSTATCGDGGLATSANFNNPIGVAVDGAGNLYIADEFDNRIRKVTAATGYISTVAGSGTLCSYSTATCGDGGSATASGADMYYPYAVAVDSTGNLYIADSADGRIRKVTVATGYISTVAGTGAICSSTTAACGDGGSATASGADLVLPTAVAVDSGGNLYIADSDDHRIRKVTATGYISTVAGTGTICSSSTATCGDGGSATSSSANFHFPSGVALDSAGNLYIGDELDNRIRKVTAAANPVAFAASTTLGTTDTTDGAYTLTLNNIGNASLSFPTPGTGTNPSISAGFTIGNSSTCPQLTTLSSAGSLASGASCTDLISFAPVTSGSISGSIVITDNSLNGNSVVQSVSMNGTATGVPASTSNSTVVVSPSPEVAGGTATVTVTLKDGSGNAINNATATFTSTSGTASFGTPSVNGNVITATMTDSVAETAPITVTLGGGAAGTLTGSEQFVAPTLTTLTVTGYSAHGILTEGSTVTVTAYDQYSNVFTGFTGNVALTSSDTHATLPSAYTFQLSDAGVHTFNVTLNTLGTQSITATSGGVSGSQTGIVVNDAIWVLNTAGTLNKLNAGGVGVTTGIGSSGTAASYGGAAFDSTGNAWSVSTASNTLYFATYMGTGATSYTGGGLNAPSSVAVDGLGYVWVANQSGNTVSEFTNAGVAQSSSSGYGSSYSSGNTLNAPSSIAIDQTGGVWVANKTGNTVTHIFGAAAPVVTPLATATANGTQGTRP